MDCSFVTIARLNWMGGYDVKSATFDWEGPLKIAVRILASAADRCVYIYLRNLESMSRKRYPFFPEKIDSALLERLAKQILRQEEKLVSIELCPGVWNGLRRQVEVEKLERYADLERAMEEIRLNQQAELEARKLSTSRGMILWPTGGLAQKVIFRWAFLWGRIFRMMRAGKGSYSG